MTRLTLATMTDRQRRLINTIVGELNQPIAIIRGDDAPRWHNMQSQIVIGEDCDVFDAYAKHVADCNAETAYDQRNSDDYDNAFDSYLANVHDTLNENGVTDELYHTIAANLYSHAYRSLDLQSQPTTQAILTDKRRSKNGNTYIFAKCEAGSLQFETDNGGYVNASDHKAAANALCVKLGWVDPITYLPRSFVSGALDGVQRQCHVFLPENRVLLKFDANKP